MDGLTLDLGSSCKLWSIIDHIVGKLYVETDRYGTSHLLEVEQKIIAVWQDAPPGIRLECHSLPASCPPNHILAFKYVADTA